jgi:hypothetical protein
MIKIADKISNVREVLERPPRDWSLERKREYLGLGQKGRGWLPGGVMRVWSDVLMIYMSEARTVLVTRKKGGARRGRSKND